VRVGEVRAGEVRVGGGHVERVMTSMSAAFLG
jgi:hypothetical protein